jgi:hypothetical protein
MVQNICKESLEPFVDSTLAASAQSLEYAVNKTIAPRLHTAFDQSVFATSSSITIAISVIENAVDEVAKQIVQPILSNLAPSGSGVGIVHAVEPSLQGMLLHAYLAAVVLIYALIAILFCSATFLFMSSHLSSFPLLFGCVVCVGLVVFGSVHLHRYVSCYSSVKSFHQQ